MVILLPKGLFRPIYMQERIEENDLHLLFDTIQDPQGPTVLSAFIDTYMAIDGSLDKQAKL